MLLFQWLHSLLLFQWMHHGPELGHGCCWSVAAWRVAGQWLHGLLLVSGEWLHGLLLVSGEWLHGCCWSVAASWSGVKLLQVSGCIMVRCEVVAGQ